MNSNPETSTQDQLAARSAEFFEKISAKKAPDLSTPEAASTHINRIGFAHSYNLPLDRIEELYTSGFVLSEYPYYLGDVANALRFEKQDDTNTSILVSPEGKFHVLKNGNISIKLRCIQEALGAANVNIDNLSERALNALENNHISDPTRDIIKAIALYSK